MPIQRSPSRNNKRRIEPFWNRIPAFFLYTLRPAPLTLTVVFGLVSFFLPYPFWPVYLLIYGLMTKYALEVLIRTSEGEMEPPPLSQEVLSDNFGLVFKLLGIYLLAILFLVSLAFKGWLVLVQGLGIAILFLLPAMTMVLASTNSLLAAINPGLLVGMIVRVGWSYLGLYVLLLAVYLAESNAKGLLLNLVGPTAVLPILVTVSFSFSVLAYHMMGYLLYEHHEALGISQRHADETAIDPTEAKLEQFQTFMEQGMTDAAKAELIGRVKDEPRNPALRRKLGAFLMVHGTEEDKVKYVSYILPILIENGQANEAAKTYLELVPGNPAFSLKRADYYLALIHALNGLGQGKLAFGLAKNIHKRFPKDTEVADIYIEMAELLSQKFSRDDLALQMLGYVLKSFPQHPRHDEAQLLASTIQRLAARS